MITRKHLSRRTLLRGAGAAIGLPLLDSMIPAMANPSRIPAAATKRMAFVYVPNGIIMPEWTPKATGTAFEFESVMKPLEPMRQKLTVLSGLTHNTGRALGDGPGDHARAAATFLTGVHPKKTAGADISLGISVDQIAAAQIGRDTRFGSLELGLEGGRQAGNCDSGYSCAYSNNISWRSATAPNPPEINPRSIFERMFGSSDPSEGPELRTRRERLNKSILDFVAEDARSLQGKVGATDRRKLDEYLTSVREIELRIANAERAVRSAGNLPPLERPDGIPENYADHARLTFDLMTLAFQADLTRVITLMMAREGSNRPYREIGVTDGHHGLTHHKGNAEWIAQIRKINQYHCEQFAYWIRKMDSIADGEGTLLDNSMIIYGSSISDGNRHLHHDLPIVLAGRGASTLKSGRHIRYAKETPLTNLYVAMLDRLGVREHQVGDSTGPLQHLSDL
jgi:hypothetical protein